MAYSLKSSIRRDSFEKGVNHDCRLCRGQRSRLTSPADDVTIIYFRVHY